MANLSCRSKTASYLRACLLSLKGVQITHSHTIIVVLRRLGYEWSNPNANTSDWIIKYILCHIKFSQSQEGDSEGQSRDRGGPSSPSGSLQEWGRDNECVSGNRGVTKVMGSMILKLQLICMRWEHTKYGSKRGQEPEHWKKTPGREEAWPQWQI